MIWKFIAIDVRRDIAIVSTARIDEGIIVGKVRTINVLYTAKGLAPVPEFEPPRELKIEQMWHWTGQSWGGLPDGTSLVRPGDNPNSQAVCLKCGVMKQGAWMPCFKCGHRPEDWEDKAKHLMTSDRYFSKADLEGISARVQSGQPLHFDPKQVEELVASLNLAKPNGIGTAMSCAKTGYGCCGLLVLVLFAVAAAVYFATK